jgi:hypothetical protein
MSHLLADQPDETSGWAVGAVHRTLTFIRFKFPAARRTINTFWTRVIDQLEKHGRVKIELRIDTLSLGLLFEPVARPVTIDLSGCDAEDVHDGWRPRVEALRFATNPSRESLLQALQAVAAVGVDVDGLRSIPWPFASCLWNGELERAVEMCREGKLGDLGDWTAAEERWRSRGLGVADLAYMTDDHCPFDQEISRVGFPFKRCSMVVSEVLPAEIVEIYHRLEDAPGSQSYLARLILWVGPEKIRLSWFTPKEFSRLMRQAEWPQILSAWIGALVDNVSWPLKGWVTCLEELGGEWKGLPLPADPLLQGRNVVSAWMVSPARKEKLEAILRQDRSLRGVLCLFGDLIAGGLPGPFDIGVRAEDFDDPQARSAAVIVELAQGRLNRERAGQLAQITVELSRERPGIVYSLVRVVNRLEVLNDATYHFLLETSRLLDQDALGARAAVLDGLNAALRRRRSGLADRKVWRELALPERLLEIVVE